MIYALSGEGYRALAALATRPVLYAFDFDGTLAPISPDRNAVMLPPSVGARLRELARRVPCAVVSGRALADLAPRVGGAVPYLIGNHGIETPTAAQEAVHAAEQVCLGWKQVFAEHLAGPFRELGIDVEDKRYSLTLHFSKAADAQRVQPKVLTLIQRLTPPPQLVSGKASMNLLPPGSGGKGPAILELMATLKQSDLFFVGDDETDENVFALREGLAMGIRVGEYPESRARYYLKHQGELEEVLRFLIQQLDCTADLAGRDAPGNVSAKSAVSEP